LFNPSLCGGCAPQKLVFVGPRSYRTLGTVEVSRPLFSKCLRLAAVMAAISVIVTLDLSVDCAGLGGLLEKSGWPLTFIVQDSQSSVEPETRVSIGALLLNLLVCGAIIVLVWYITGTVTDRRSQSVAKRQELAQPPD